MSVVLNIATGNIGGALAKHLLDLGESIVVINREADKVQSLADRGAKVVVGHFNDESVLERACAGAKALFWMLPPATSPNYTEWTRAATRKAVAAAKKANIEKIVYISSIGAQGGESIGAIATHHVNEQAFFSQFRNVTVIRPGMFMENYLRDISTLVSHGTVYSPFAGSPYPSPHVATIDIAKRAAAYLTTEWKGQHTVGVLGPKDVTYDEVWASISKVIGVPVKTVNVTLDQVADGMKSFGLPAEIVQGFVDMYKAFMTGVAFGAEVRTPNTTTSTSVTEWAETVFKPAYEAAKQQPPQQQQKK